EDCFCQINADKFIVHIGHLESDFVHLNHGTLRCRGRGDHLSRHNSEAQLSLSPSALPQGE
ncbi:hypothetical protein, partial [Shewanella glacialipiscicola]|uniref:hypothetical protein n=1 Tax=Shewanella glacialipiscicola TaxID=614069 RepID=UPI001C7F2528